MVHSNILRRIFLNMSPIGLNSLETKMKVLSPNCHDFKKLSVRSQTIRSLCNCTYFQNVFLKILIAVWDIKVFLIPWYTHPFLSKYILTQETYQAVFVKKDS